MFISETIYVTYSVITGNYVMLINCRHLFILTIIYCYQVLITFRTIISYMFEVDLNWFKCGWYMYIEWTYRIEWTRISHIWSTTNLITTTSTTYHLPVCWWQKIYNESNINQAFYINVTSFNLCTRPDEVKMAKED